MNGTVSAAEKTFAYIRGLIHAGKLVSGDPLPSERELQETLGISRIAIREGIAKLDALGIIDRSKGRVSVINTLIDISSLSDVMLPLFSTRDEKVIDDLIRTRVVMEKETAGTAAVIRTEEDLEELAAIISAMETLIEEGPEFSERDYQFHLRLARIADNRVLEAILGALHRQIRLFIDRSTKDQSQREEALRFHREILQAITQKDRERAEALMHLHITDCKIAYEARTQ